MLEWRAGIRLFVVNSWTVALRRYNQQMAAENSSLLFRQFVPIYRKNKNTFRNVQKAFGFQFNQIYSFGIPIKIAPSLT
jgi:hypothetical protein